MTSILPQISQKCQVVWKLMQGRNTILLEWYEGLKCRECKIQKLKKKVEKSLYVAEDQSTLQRINHIYWSTWWPMSLGILQCVSWTMHGISFKIGMIGIWYVTLIDIVNEQWFLATVMYQLYSGVLQRTKFVSDSFWAKPAWDGKSKSCWDFKFSISD